MNGILNILKPAGMTSHDVVNTIRKLLGEKKVGHTGTLDPMAVGVLPICIGGATRIIEYLDADYKKYRCEMQLGFTSDTEDIWGEIICQKPVVIDRQGITKEKISIQEGATHIAEKALIDATSRFVGEIMQKPPNYSAVRIGGRRLYEYARSGEDIHVEPRKINVRSLSIKKIDYDHGRATFDIESSKGSYIRTICTQIGGVLGCGAVMSFLVRTACGKFDLSDSSTIEEIEEALHDGKLQEILLPADYPLGSFNALKVKDPTRAQKFINGGPLDLSDVEGELPQDNGLFRVYCRNVFIAMARYNVENGKIISHKVFCRDIQ